ncbi:MAG: tRNA (adenosine(37)-N6)-threonylcarbamoyltransferase complex dimerization subunit type 1 TsaB [Kordiimonadales bacterium]|nr:MAG: tRNA (adenosine(37)-N6)-threonylcarbamoyltransferase complex dimerization subunit type 1 TsaB [Kordiimonadales bacterium]
MTLLAIDTSEINCSAALLLADGGSFQCSEAIGRGHAERLLPMIEELLAEAGITYGDIKRIAVTTGPGTFTGLRIGLSVARGLALSLAVPCVGVSGLVILAAQAPVSLSGVVHALIKGRGGQVYYQPFSKLAEDQAPTILEEAANIDAAEVLPKIKSRAGITIGSGVPTVLEIEQGVDAYAQEDVGHAIDILVLAKLAGELDPAGYLPEPTYLRPADAVRAAPIIKIHQE